MRNTHEEASGECEVCAYVRPVAPATKLVPKRISRATKPAFPTLEPSLPAAPPRVRELPKIAPGKGRVAAFYAKSAAALFVLALLPIGPLAAMHNFLLATAFTLGVVGLLGALREQNRSALLAALTVQAGTGWLLWAAAHAPLPVTARPLPTPVASTDIAAKGILFSRADAPVATLFYRQVGAEKWRFVDCSPQVTLAVSPGRYQVRIEGVGAKTITKEREIEVLSGQRVDVTPDR